MLSARLCPMVIANKLLKIWILIWLKNIIFKNWRKKLRIIKSKKNNFKIVQQIGFFNWNKKMDKEEIKMIEK